MKLTKRRRAAGFTLIELMAVITIIVILAGLVIGGMGFVSERQAKEKARVQLALLGKGIEEFKLDMGFYPPTNNSATGTGDSNILYRSLFYDGYDYNRQPNPPATWGPANLPRATRIYIADLDPTSSKQGWVPNVSMGSAIIATNPILDPWGNEYRYRSSKNSNGVNNPDTINPDFDLWSAGKNGASTPAGAAALDEKNNADDIRNF